MGQHVGYVVVLEEPVNDEYSLEQIVVALGQIKGVISVKPVPHSLEVAVAESRVRHELTMKLYDLARDFSERKKT